MKKFLFILLCVNYIFGFCPDGARANVKDDAIRLWNEKQFEECYEANKKLLYLEPEKQAQWRYMMGNCKIHLGKVEESFPEYLEALKGVDCKNGIGDSVQTNIMSTTGEFAALQGKPEIIIEAIQLYGEPRFSKSYHTYRKWHAGYFGDWKALGKTKVKDIMTYYLALAYYNSGDKAKAKSTLESAPPEAMKGYVSINYRDCPRLEEEVPLLLAKCNE